ARSGQALAVRSFAEISPSSNNCEAATCTDGKRIFLPAEMELGSTLKTNETYYRLLAGLELASIEARSFAFDFTLWQRECESKSLGGFDYFSNFSAAASEEFRFSDYYAFFALFPTPDLAEKLFNLAEFTRVRSFLERYYPGFAQRVKIITEYGDGLSKREATGEPLAHCLYVTMVEGKRLDEGGFSLSPEVWDGVLALLEDAKILQVPEVSVSASADWVVKAYGQVANLLMLDSGGSDLFGFLDFRFPWARRLRLDLVYMAHQQIEKKAHLWREELDGQGVDVDKSVLKKILADESLALTPELLRQLLEGSGAVRNTAGRKLKRLPSGVDLEKLFPEATVSGAVSAPSEQVPTFWYDEWDYRLNDYLKNHVKLLEHRRVGGDDSFYQQAIIDNSGLIHRIRRNFELIRPEAMQILRHWPEGDAFDYDALLEYAIDRKMRITPDDRLYRKRLKVDRDVAVFVLVDLSSSTRKAVHDGSGKSVLAVEKEALVLFCEALERVGDAYALAGFSGSGRLASEFFYLKSFNEPLNDEVKGRIGGVRPEKNTRMGPAIRHAAKELKEYPARVKLMIVLSDG
ncbi:VWA domain-containing protein, partial [bacterium]|nr:VWA domain-containing protein [bacterium]